LDTWSHGTKRTQTNPISPAGRRFALAQPQRTLNHDVPTVNNDPMKKQSQFSKRSNERKALFKKYLHEKSSLRTPETKTLFEKTKPISGKTKCT